MRYTIEGLAFLEVVAEIEVDAARYQDILPVPLVLFLRDTIEYLCRKVATAKAQRPAKLGMRLVHSYRLPREMTGMTLVARQQGFSTP